MRTDDFDYPLPAELVAQYPCEKRDECRLLYLERKSGCVSDHGFKELPGLLSPGDRLVFNDTKVIPGRLYCRRESGGRVELLLTEPVGDGTWKALVRPGRRLKTGTRVVMNADPSIVIELKTVNQDGTRNVSLVPGSSAASLFDVIGKHGMMALPHYIKRPAEGKDKETYQTVFASREGAVASPTAGLHFTRDLMHAISQRGINISYVTLHVGIGTFRPVRVDNPEEHRMHEESFELTEETAAKIKETKERGGRIIAVGTTVVRVLEHCALLAGLQASAGKTSLMILPGYGFKVVDGMVTNFHVPQSTLLMLVSAFAGREVVLSAYDHAVSSGYRFFSYGDAMLVL